MEFPPKDKREPRRFEPPPWEEPQRKQAEEAQPPMPEPATEPEPVVVAPLTETPPAVVAPQPGTVAAPQPEGEAPIDDKAVDAMLFELSAAERTEFGVDARGMGLGASIAVGFIGAVITVYAIVAFARTSGAGIVALSGAAILGAMGVMLLIAAAWLFMRANNRRGV